jgi:hypothetical protein
MFWKTAVNGGGGDDGNPPWRAYRNLVLKKALSSGMKGVCFADDPSYAAAFEACRKIPYSAVLQEEIPNKVRRLSYFERTGALKYDTFQLRLTAYFDLVRKRLVDMDVTACRDKNIHGRKDSLLFGAALEP